MTVAPVGLRCPDHSGRPQGVARVRSQVRRAGWAGTGALVTKALIAINVAVWLAELGTGSGPMSLSGTVYEKGALFGPLVAHGDWWRLVTAGFLGRSGPARFGGGHAAYGRIGLVGIAGMVLVGVGSVVVAYWKVHGYA